MKCPNCERELDNIDTIDTEWECGAYYDFCVGECPYCNKKYTWVEVFTLDRIQEIEEVKDED